MRMSRVHRLVLAIALGAVIGIVPPPAHARQTPHDTIVFQHDGDIYTIQPDGSELRRLTSSGDNRTPAWSPNGKRIAFVSGRAGNLDVYVMRRDGSEVVNITNTPGNELTPDWHPGGKSLIYTARPEGNRHHHLFTIRLPHGSPRQLTFDRFLNDYPTNNGESDASYSPDGRFILATQRTGDEGSAPAIFLTRMNADGSGSAMLTIGIDDEREGAYSPQGDRVVLAASQDYAYEARPHNLFITNPDGSGTTQLTHSVEFGEPEYRNPSWSPDGRRLVFSSRGQTPARSGLHIMETDGTGLRALTAGVEPDWQAPRRHRR